MLLMFPIINLASNNVKFAFDSKIVFNCDYMFCSPLLHLILYR